MAFPIRREVQLPLLQVISDMGGRAQVSRDALIDEVAKYFPQITPDEFERVRPDGNTHWYNLVAWVRYELVKQGDLQPGSVSGRGIWAISDKGRARLARERHLLPWRAIRRSEPIVRENGSEYEERVMRLREARSQTQRQLVGIGAILQRFALSDFRQDGFQYDVIWKQAQHLPRATHCFQIDSAERLPNALPLLKRASDIWGARLFLVTTDESEIQTARERLMPHFSGEFQAIGADANVLTAADVNALYDAVNPMHELLGAMLRN